MTAQDIGRATEAEIDYCQFHQWYPILQTHSIKGEVIHLDHEFVQYLNEDGIMLPGSSSTANNDSDSEDSIDGKVLKVHSEVPEFTKLKSLQEQIKAVLDNLCKDELECTNRCIVGKWRNSEVSDGRRRLLAVEGVRPSVVRHREDVRFMS